MLLLGNSGAGKTTLLHLLCGLLTPTSGRLTVGSKSLHTSTDRELDRWRGAEVGVIFQQFNLLPFGTVADNILLPLRFAPDRRRRAGDGRARALMLCQALGLPEAVLSARAGTLSVGQQQRVAVARALIGEPPLLVADEPTSALDAGTQAAFLDLLFEQARACGSALLMVSHDPRLAARFDRVLQMEDIAQSKRGAA